MLYFARIIALAGNLINLHCCVALATPLNLVHPTVSDPLSIACLLADVRLFTRGTIRANNLYSSIYLLHTGGTLLMNPPLPSLRYTTGQVTALA